ncbi:MAG: peptide ABC transporter substrate-binding protein [Caldilinea sp.]
MTWQRSLLSLLLVAAFVLSACAAPSAPSAPPAAAPGEQAAAGEPVRGGVAIIGSPQEPGVLSPLLASSSIEDAISSFTIEGLVQVDNQGNYVPVLAEALPEMSEDGLVATYKLKPDVKFSNGDPFTCADVQFTFEAIMSDLSGASTAGYNRIDEIECVDDLTAVVYFSRVYAPYLRLFSYIIPRGAGDLAALDSWEYNRNPIGTGPWIVKEWVSGDYIEFMPNPYYREEGKPYLDSVIVKILPSREVGMQLLGTGEITALWDITEADFPTLESMADRGVTYAGAQTGENELLLFNFADPAVDAPPSADEAPHPVLSDVRVREAIQLAIDKQEIVDTLLYGNVNVGTTVLPSGAFACPQPPSEFNIEKANALLDEAGWVVGADGIRTKDGVKAELKITTTSGNLLREQTQQVLVEMLKPIGVSLVIQNVPSDVLFAGWASNGMRKKGKFDILLYTTGPFLDPDSHLYQNYHSANIPTAANEGAGSNFSRYANADVDAWIDEAASITDPAARRDLYCKVAAQINKDIPRAFLYERLLLSGVRTNLQNFTVSPGPADFTWGSADWWLAQ